MADYKRVLSKLLHYLDDFFFVLSCFKYVNTSIIRQKLLSDTIFGGLYWYFALKWVDNPPKRIYNMYIWRIMFTIGGIYDWKESRKRVVK